MTRATVDNPAITEAKNMAYNSDIHYNEEAFEYEGTDLRGTRWWGQTWSECAERVNEANRVIAKHRQECPEDGWAWGECGDVMTQDADSAGFGAL